MVLGGVFILFLYSHQGVGWSRGCAATRVAPGDAGHSLTDRVWSQCQTFHGDYRQLSESRIQGDCRHGGHANFYPGVDRAGNKSPDRLVIPNGV